MTVAIVGTSAPGKHGTDEELRIVADGIHVATLRSSVLSTLTVEGASHLIPYCKAELKFTDRLVAQIIRQGVVVELWAGLVNQDWHRIFNGRVEYVELDFVRADDVTKVVFEARGLGAALIEAPFKGDATGSVGSVIGALVSPSGLAVRTDYPSKKLDVWVHADSTYAVLRLLGASLGALVRSRDDTVEFLSYEAVLKRMHTTSPMLLDASKAISSRLVQGRPVKK